MLSLAHTASSILQPAFDVCAATVPSTNPSGQRRRSLFTGTTLDPLSYSRFLLGGDGTYEHSNGTAMADQAYISEMEANARAPLRKRFAYKVGGVLMKRLPASFVSSVESSSLTGERSADPSSRGQVSRHLVRLVLDPDPEHVMHLTDDTAFKVRDLPKAVDLVLEDKSWNTITVRLVVRCPSRTPPLRTHPRG